MTSTKIGIFVGIIIVIIGLVAVLSSSDSNSEESFMTPEENSQNTEIIESDNSNYYINEDGNKVFVIDATDSLTIND